MEKLWINNNLEDRLFLLAQTTDAHAGMNQLAVEKDWWVCLTLKALFRCSCANAMIFKGGTSLSKGFGVIDRFSEDIDLAISHAFFGIDKTNKSQKEKLRKMARAYIHETLSKELDEQLLTMGISGYRIENVKHRLDKSGTPIPNRFGQGSYCGTSTLSEHCGRECELYSSSGEDRN